MLITKVGTMEAGSAGAYEKDEDILLKSYTYKDGRGQEIVYYKKDCVELSSLMEHYTIPVGSDTYEKAVKQIKSQQNMYAASWGSRMSHESYEVMQDYYAGKLDKDEVKDIFKEYIYHAVGAPRESEEFYPGSSFSYQKQRATQRLAGLYEHFSRANASNACVMNNEEGQALLVRNGIPADGAYYYNADWYWACEEMQELFRETANELADEYGAEHVDFESVEKNTMFSEVGGITYNGVWSCVVWQSDASVGSKAMGNLRDTSMVPPKNFIYCSCRPADSSEPKQYMEAVKKEVNAIKNKSYEKVMFLIAESRHADIGKSLLLDKKNYGLYSGTAEEDMFQGAMAFLKNANTYYRANRMEFVWMAR